MSSYEITESQSAEIKASNVRKSTMVDYEGAVDVDVTLEWEGTGRTIKGEVTLLPATGDGFRSWGSLDNWLSVDLIKELGILTLGQFKSVVEAIEAETTAAAERAL